MTLRTKSKAWQWQVWMGIAFALLIVYIFFSLAIYGTIVFNPFNPRHHRLILPFFLLFVYCAWETRWDGIVRDEDEAKVTDETKAKGDGEDETKVKSESEAESTAKGEGEGENEAKVKGEGEGVGEGKAEGEAESTASYVPPRPIFAAAPVPTNPASDQPAEVPSGEELFNHARTLTHQAIPDLIVDGEYLNLLASSAAQGFTPAMAKLGEYAMRRSAWVEAYYWMTLARRNGMHNLLPVLGQIRQNWVAAGLPNEDENVYALFPLEAGSVGRALLHIDFGYDAPTAREFLRTHHPEFL